MRTHASVSIRAPVVRPERPAHGDSQAAARHGFNPRSGCETGATSVGSVMATTGWSFNPRSGCETGATHAQNRRLPLRKVSIRAPVVRPERRALATLYVRTRNRFNPRSGCETGATWERFLDNRQVLCFNPRSGCETGATLQVDVWLSRRDVSIRAPVVRPERQRGL